MLACVYSDCIVCSTYFTRLLKIALAPCVTVCLCVTDTSKSGGKASLAARAVSQPSLQLSVWLACTTILSVACPVCGYVCVCACVWCGVCQIGDACVKPYLLILLGWGLWLTVKANHS